MIVKFLLLTKNTFSFASLLPNNTVQTLPKLSLVNKLLLSIIMLAKDLYLTRTIDWFIFKINAIIMTVLSILW